VRHFVVVKTEERGVVPLDAYERKVIVVEDGRVAAITEKDFSQVHAARKSRDTG
jgi:imidazolonepropionase-like amidohydrolase